MYRHLIPRSEQRLPLRMLFQPAGGGTFHRACEADSPRGLVAGLLDDPDYETAAKASRLQSRLRLASDLALLLEVDGEDWQVSDHDGPQLLNVHSDPELLRSLEHSGFVSLAFDQESSPDAT